MNIKYYASDGSIKILGDDELAHFNHNHDALGRFAKSAGSVGRKVSTQVKKMHDEDVANTVARKYKKINKRQSQIDKYDRKINSTRNQKRLYKSEKYDAKLYKAERKAKKASMRRAAGYKLSNRQAKKLMKVEKLKAKSAGKYYKTEKWTAKAQNREYKNYRDAKKINKLVNKYGDVAMSEVRSDDRTKAVQMYLENSQNPIKRKNIYNR